MVEQVQVVEVPAKIARVTFRQNISVRPYETATSEISLPVEISGALVENLEAITEAQRYARELVGDQLNDIEQQTIVGDSPKETVSPLGETQSPSETIIETFSTEQEPVVVVQAASAPVAYPSATSVWNSLWYQLSSKDQKVTIKGFNNDQPWPVHGTWDGQDILPVFDWLKTYSKAKYSEWPDDLKAKAYQGVCAIYKAVTGKDYQPRK